MVFPASFKSFSRIVAARKFFILFGRHKRRNQLKRSVSEAQGQSLGNQTAYYQNLIESNLEYEYAGVFADHGLTGTKDERLECQKMLNLARNNQLDLILTKSISRFARNTTIVLEVVRELKT